MTSRPVIEILYFDSCPNHERLLAQLHRLLPLHQTTTEIVQHNITDVDSAQRARFLGSRSIRVNGRDIEPGADRGRRMTTTWSLASTTSTSSPMPHRARA